jgi:uncharacterized delta-60 repeat protein
VIAGTSYNVQGSGEKLFAARLSSSGVLDSGFGTGGMAVHADSAWGYCLAVQPDGKVVVGGSRDPFPHGVIARFSTSGALDPAFDGDGIVLSNYSYAGFRGLGLQPDGKIVAAADEFVQRYQANGGVDFSFGQFNGVASCDLSAFGVDLATALALDGAGRILVATEGHMEYFPNPGSLFFLGRLQGDGATDVSFGQSTSLHGLHLGLPFPNPSRGIMTARLNTAEGTPVDASIVDVAGRRVRTFDVSPGNVQDLFWNGDADDGRPAAPGVYYLRVTQGDAKHSQTIVRMK